MEAYLDNSATTKPCKRACEAALRTMENDFGNPSSLHKKGFDAMQILENSRGVIAKSLGVDPERIFFTPSGTVANNTAIFGAVELMKRKGNKIVTTAFEHPSVARCMDKLEQSGFEVVRIAPDERGNISEEAFQNAIDEKTVLVSLMAVNNEVGTVLPFDKIKRIIKRKKSPALLHVDCVQGYMKLPVKPERCGIDLMSVSAHKIHALKGSGALYIANGVRIKPYVLGGGQENNICSGTQAMPNIAAFSAAVEELADIEKRLEKVTSLNGYFKSELEKIEGVKINSPDNALPYIINASIGAVPSQVSVNYLSSRGVYVSAGSACSKGHRSDVLVSMGLSPERIDSAIRLSMSYETTKEEIDYALSAIKSCLAELSKK